MIKKYYILFTVFALNFLNFRNVFATHCPTEPLDANCVDPNHLNSGSAATTTSIKLTNPLAPVGDPTGGINDIPHLVEAILNIVLMVGVPLVALGIIYSGYKFIEAQGAPDKLKEAKETLVYVLIGAAILLGAYAIAEAVVGTVNAVRGQ